MVSVFLVLILGWVWLGFTGAREMFPDLQARLSSYGDHVPRILRVCLGWILLSSAFGVEPRFGIDPFTVPTFLAPDLDIQQLGDSWAWLRWAEIVLGLTILFGLYVRIFAALLIVLCLLGVFIRTRYPGLCWSHHRSLYLFGITRSWKTLRSAPNTTNLSEGSGLARRATSPEGSSDYAYFNGDHSTVFGGVL